MSLFICDECGCVENSNLCSSFLPVGTNGCPNLSTMEMQGFGKKYEETGIREDVILLCSECNTGIWHDEFIKKPATEVEIKMGEQLTGDVKNVFTFHPLWKKYNNNPSEVTIDTLDEFEVESLLSRDDDRKLKLKEYDENLFNRNLWTNHNPYIREEPKIGRNDTCPCNSGMKYKRCCMNKDAK